MYKDGETYLLVIEWDTGEKADGLQLWNGWVWTKSGPTDRPARKVCPFSDYVSKFEL